MADTSRARTNEPRITNACDVLERAIRATTQPGFHGHVSVEVEIQDGIIQKFEQDIKRVFRPREILDTLPVVLPASEGPAPSA